MNSRGGDCKFFKRNEINVLRKKFRDKMIDMVNPEILTDLSMKGVFARMAPILQIDDKFYNKEIIDGNKLNINKVKEIIKTLKV